MSALTQDLRYALRTFLNSPGSTAVAILVLSLGIGANAAIFSVTSAICFVLCPTKTRNLVFVWESNYPRTVGNGGFRRLTTGISNPKSSLDRMGAMRFQSSVLTVGEMPERIETAAVSPSVFEILGMTAGAGTIFAPDEDQPDRNRVAILSAGLWQRRFGRDPNILGKTLTLDGGSFTIVGVAPPQFRASRKPV